MPGEVKEKKTLIILRPIGEVTPWAIQRAACEIHRALEEGEEQPLNLIFKKEHGEKIIPVPPFKVRNEDLRSFKLQVLGLTPEQKNKLLQSSTLKNKFLPKLEID